MTGVDIIGAQHAHSYKVRAQHRQWKRNKYNPHIYPVSKAMELGDRAKPIINSAYFTTPKSKPASSAHRLTGVFIKNPDVALGVEASARRKDRTHYVAGSMGGVFTGSAVINLKDQTEKNIPYGNPHISYQYDFQDSAGMPELEVLRFQVCSHAPFYKGAKGNLGGTAGMILNFKKIHTGEVINLVVQQYAPHQGQSLKKEKVLRFDKNNGGLHAAGYVGKGTRFITCSDRSAETQYARTTQTLENPFSDHFDFLVTHKTFPQLLTECEPFFNKRLGTWKNWRLGAVIMQYELQEGGEGVLAGAYSALQVSYL